MPTGPPSTSSGEAVRVYRNKFGRPHIFAATNRGPFTAYGYTVAQDRLWQLELNRRAGLRCDNETGILPGA